MFGSMLKTHLLLPAALQGLRREGSKGSPFNANEGVLPSSLFLHQISTIDLQGPSVHSSVLPSTYHPTAPAHGDLDFTCHRLFRPLLSQLPSSHLSTYSSNLRDNSIPIYHLSPFARAPL